MLSRARGRHLGLAVLLLALTFANAAANEAPIVDEYPVKAGFLLYFAKFVIWPTATFEGPESPIEICVAGRDPFGGALEHTIGERTVRGRPIAVRRIDAAGKGADCEIVFFPDSARAPVLARRLGRAPVLTVGETAGFAEAGGMVNFRIEGDRVRFEINPAAVSRAGLRVSSQLLNLATIVREEPR